MKARIISGRVLSAMAAAAMTVSCVSLSAWAYDEEYDNVFTFTDTAVTAENESGSGFKISGTDLTINQAGTYVVSGSCVEGTIKIKASTTGVVLVLEDLTLTSSTGSPLSVNKGAETTIVIEGTNTIKDAEDPANETSTDTEVADAFDGAAIKVKTGASATFTGTGTLNVDGSECKNGIKGAATASITVGASTSDTFTMNVSAANNALASDGSVTVNGGKLNLTADGDGLKASPDEDDTDSAGTVTINGGDITIVSGEDGIQADGGFTMTGGTVDVTAAGGYKYNSQIEAADISAKGIKSDSSIVISGGTVTIDSADDGIHLNGTTGNEAVLIKDGNITIKSGDDGIHSDYYLTVSGGTINVGQSYEGLEGAVVDLAGGKGTIISSDDGINAANGDLTSYAFDLRISGGEWYINAGGDGLDSNGDINISGGYTEVFGSSQGDNAALDYGDFNASFNVTGGTVVGIGMSNMATTPTSGSCIVFGSSGGMGGGFGGQFGGQTSTSSVSLSQGDSVVIKDSSGNTVYSTTAVKSANHIVFASDTLDSSETYTLYVNGTSKATATVSQGSGQQGPGQQGPGEQGGNRPGQPGEDPFSQNFTYSVTLNTDDETLSAETVTVIFSDGSREMTAQTDSTGAFSVPMGLMDGTYTMTVSAEGFAARTYTVTMNRGQLSEDPAVILDLLGDINGDKKLNATDLLLAKSHIKGVSLLTDYQLECADIDASGSITAADLLRMKSHIKGVTKLW